MRAPAIPISLALAALVCVSLSVASKLDVLGDTFKRNVNQVKKWTQIDLIFLVDASSSVGEENFASELRFVRKLLSDLTVSNEHTKVALITFGSQDSIITHINDVTNSNETNKCILLNELLPNIKYTGGGTYTIGAFKEAKRIVEYSARNNTKKAIFLITDGFSNGGDPVQVAQELKKDYNVTIFTIGIKTGRGDELQNLSSSPETCYLLHGFREFESLARRALHADLQDGEYVPVSKDKCGDTCDSEAECTCGTGNGQYACKCRRGYYGDGIQCHSCPKGTWHRAKDGICIPCLDPNHESYKATSPEECKCKRGYTDNGNGRCEVVRCPELEAPENGYFVGVPIKTGKCQNVLNNACGVRCHVGYSLRGNSIRLCQENGTWTGIEPQCIVKTCIKPPSPQYGQVIECVNRDLDTKYGGDTIPDDMPVDTECKFGCGKGHSMTGSTVRTCLPVAQWDGLRTTCKPVRCNRLGKVTHGHWEPEGCAKERQPFAARCTVVCKRGFVPSGDSLTCKSAIGRGAGKWHGSGNKCLDNEPPIIKCPAEHVEVKTQLGSQYGIAKWGPPKVADNSGLDVTVWLDPSEDEEEHEANEFEIGLNLVTYHAVDSSGNEATCNMTVRVIDEEPPVIENCESPPPFLTADPATSSIQWDEPLAWDNSKGPVNMTRSRDFGIFEAGTTEVVYIATDMFNNTNTCVINITVIAEANCETPPMEAICNPTPGGVTCALTCQEGYGFALTDKAVCLHDTPGVWDVPECTPTETPNEIWEVLNAETDCTDNETIEKIGTIVKEDGGVVLLSGCDRSKRSVDEQKRPNRKIEFRTKNSNKILEKAEELGVNVTIGQPLINCKNGSVPAIRPPGQKIRCVLCPKGTYFADNRCVPCPPDTFSSKPGTFICEACPTGRSTMGRKRAKAKRACRAVCPTGTDKTQKGTTCEGRSRKRISCDRPNVCKNGGTCTPVGKSRHKCVCSPGWIGARCRIRAKVCLCQNGGSCLDNDSKCVCPDGLVGDFCELFVSDLTEPEDKTEFPPSSACQLVKNLCENNSTCIDTSDGSYKCECVDGFIGRRCNILPCDYNPCTLNTICSNILEVNATKQSFICNCPKGKQNPPECNTTVDNCASSPCLNGATCLSLEPDSFKCQCKGLFYGEHCELLKDPDYVLHFPRSGINDFVIIDGPGTNLSEVTMCGWIQTSDKGNYGTVLSYATFNHDNAFTVTDYSGLVLYVNGRHVVTDVRLNDGRWHHLCVTWKMSEGAYSVYVDSKLETSGLGLSDGTHILGNGKIVLGQEQDTLGGRFSRSESFIGKLSYVDLWNKALNRNEVLETMHGCTASHIGNVRTWADFKNGTRGFVHIENSTFCSNCSAPLTPTNGQVTVAPDDRSATYKCDKGYVLHFQGQEIQGNMLIRQCTAASQWDGFDEPKCEPVSCPYPGYVPHARVIGKFYNIRYKDQLVYNCLPGYEPSVPQVRTCTENGTWSGLKPLCRGGQCDNFPRPENSNISVVSEHIYDENLFDDISLFEVGTQLEIGCLNDAVLQGEKLISCQENGTWDNEIPKCAMPGCTANEMPSIPANSYTLNEISGVTFDVGTIIAFKCRNGHNEAGNNFTECLNSGKWAKLNMMCSPIECVEPTSYDNMHYRNGYNISTYYFGNMLKYECEEGYTFYGINSVRCLASGKWTRLKGKCGRISCNKPNVSPGESFIGTSYLYKESLTVICPAESANKNYTMTCTSAGKWLQVGNCSIAR